jgi:hypothetical protein
MKKPVISQPAALGKRKKMLVHGPSGAGKTRFASTWPNPIIFDIEGGTMSIDKGMDVAVVEKGQITLATLNEYIDWLATADAKQYETVVIDSLTHLQNEFLAEKLPGAKDPRQVYGAWMQYVRETMNKLFNLDKNIVVICRSKMGEDIEGAEKLFPELAPSAFTMIPALVDFALVITGETTGLGNNAKTTQYAYAQHPKYWTKTRAIVDPKFAPTYEAFVAAVK